MKQDEQSSTDFSPDELDHAILNALEEDSRLSYREIAKRLKKSPVTIINRIRAMEDAGIIKKYTVMLDHDQLGFDITALISLRISKGKLFAVEKKLADNPHVVALYDHTGEFDATIIGRFRNRRSMDAFLKRIQTYEFIERTRTQLVLNIIKEDWGAAR
ncbi:MAG: Lrp/AsnC family transcriptional regulator [archaeon]